MGSDLYDVRALAKKRRTVSLDVRVVHPDAMHIPADPSFALMMLREGADDEDPLAREVAFQDTLDPKWMTRFATTFIEAVRVHDVEQTKRSMRARLEVTVTQDAWVAHVAKGKAWPSRAFELVDRYDAPSDGPAAPVRIDDAFMWAPRECFVGHGAPASTPALLEVPAYAPSAYAIVDEMAPPNVDPKRLASWLGRAVVVKDTYGVHHGAFAAVDDGAVVILSIDELSLGCARVGVRSIGRLVPKTGRRGAKLGYARVLGAARVTASSVAKRGAAVEIVLRVPPDGRAARVDSESDVLDLLVAPLRTQSHMRLRPSALTSALEADLEARGLEGAHRLEEIYAEIARRYVASFEVEATPFTPPDWDALTHAEARARLEAPWPTVTLRATLTDARWAEHLDAPIVMRSQPLPPAMRVPPEPKRPERPTAPPPDARAVMTKGDRVWTAERRGATVATRTGKKARERDTKTKTHASAEKARAAFERDVASKQKDGWAAAPAGAAALVEQRLGMRFDDTTGALFVTKVGPPSDAITFHDITWFKPGDRVTGVGPMGAPDAFAVATIEELALALAPHRPGAIVYLQCDRPASGVGTAEDVRML